MTETGELATNESESDVPDRLNENAAVARCVCAWRLTMSNERAELDEDESEFEAKQAANDAYLAAMPPLDGYENIRDFIACVTCASMMDVIRQKDAEYYLAAAKIALAVLRHEPKHADSAPRRPGRPRKTTPTEENK